MSKTSVDIRAELGSGRMSIGGPAAALRDSFAYQHLCRALEAEPTWTPEMVCAFNDYSEEFTHRLCQLYRQEHRHVAQR